jgi:hypothetical protein
VGVLYILATVAGIVSLGFTDPVLTADDYLTEVSANETEVFVGALLELVMAVSVAGIAIAVYPVLKRYTASIAIGYFAARIVEALIFIMGVVSLLSLVTLSREFMNAAAPDTAYFHTLGELFLAARDWGGHVVLDVAVFPLGALLFYFVLYQSKLVPRWVSGWGLIGAPLYWVAGFLVLFDVIEPLSTSMIVLQAPLGLQEMVLALWLIVKGFDSSAIAAQAATE